LRLTVVGANVVVGTHFYAECLIHHSILHIVKVYCAQSIAGFLQIVLMLAN
jgi:hypothetical protein